MALFNPSRDQVRQFFFDTWAKFQQQQSLTDLEGIALQVIQMHPEYYVVLNTSEKYMEQAYFPEMGETNPFLHMSLHMSILEQISINQPIGIADAYQKLRVKHGNESDAQHDLMDCLAETIWQAQRTGQSLDGAAYLECIKAKLA
jgi:hypothetical protein